MCPIVTREEKDFFCDGRCVSVDGDADRVIYFYQIQGKVYLYFNISSLLPIVFRLVNVRPSHLGGRGRGHGSVGRVRGK
jgi:hypothetical protein